MERFYLPTDIITGRGCLAELGRVTARYGQRAMLVCGARSAQCSGLLARAAELLRQAGVQVTIYDKVTGEAELPVVEEGIRLAQQEGCDVFVGIGGGSAMDTAKAIAGLMGLPGTVWEYHQGRKLEHAGFPLITVPTTAGTGAEVTKNAVLINPTNDYKTSIRDDSWYAKAALVDPELTLSMPPAVTASTGSDALCQAIESFTSLGASDITDALARQAIVLIGDGLYRAYSDGSDLDARDKMSMGSLLAGMAMSNARLGAVHGMAHPLGARYHIPHGVVCCLLLPYTMAYNLPYALGKYAEIATLMGVNTDGLTPQAAAESAVERVRELVESIGVPLHLREFGVREDALDPIIEESLPSSSLKHNPRVLDAEDVRNILIAAL
ncbi:MAG: iron-containing alcohol dehydrogenase [Chloroflexi bacterium]|nr:iron-containing alcohol dehydrogenase [Chloroflexota bacterium]